MATVEADSTAEPLQYDGQPLLIGADLSNTRPAWGFSGLLDELRIYGTARSQAQIVEGMSPCSPAGDSDLIGLYSVNEGMGAEASATSLVGAPGRLSSMTALSDTPTWTASGRTTIDGQ